VTAVADIGKGWTLPATLVPVEMTPHAALTFRERCSAVPAPAPSDPVQLVRRRRAIHREVADLLEGATVTRDAPDWANDSHDGHRADAWLHAAELAAPLYIDPAGTGYRIGTVITRELVTRTAVSKAQRRFGDRAHIGTLGERGR